MSTRNTKAFTLVELLVVVVVIALLIVLITPTFTRIFVFTRRTQCNSNLHQFALAMLAYTNTNNGIFPSTHSGGPVDFDHTWIGAVYPFISNKQLAHCPAINTYQAEQGLNGFWGWDGSEMHLGYGFNMWFLGGSLDPGRQNEWDLTRIKMVPYTHVLAVKDPGMCIMVADRGVKVYSGGDAGCGISLFWPWVNHYREGVNGTRHDNAGNVNFVDGHVQTFLDPDRTINPPTDDSGVYIEYWDNLQRKELWGL